MDFLATPARRRILFASLYASEGAPIGFLWWAFPTILRSRGVPLDEITGLTALLVLPWALKFLWAPAIDVLRSRWPLKQWILLSQFVMGASLVPLVFLDPQSNLGLLTAVLLMHAVAAATQDVSIDALCIRTTSPRERGSLNGWMQTGMLLSRSLLGGGTLIVLQAWGMTAVVLSLITVVWSSSILLLQTRPGAEDPSSTPAIPRFVDSLRSAFSRRQTWLVLLFALISGAAFEAVGAVGGPFLIDQGCTEEEIGVFFLVPAVVCMAVGAIAGGMLSDVLPRISAVRIFLAGTAASVLILSALDAAGSGLTPVLGALAFVYFTIGLFVASTYALFMDHTDPRLGATQFSTYMGATNLCESWSAFGIGRISGILGYAGGFALMAAVSLASLAILPFLTAGKLTDSKPS